MNCTALNSNQIETTPNNHPRLAVNTAVARNTVGVPVASSATPGIFFHHTNNLLDVPRPNNSEEENSPTELNSCRRIAEKPPLVKRLTMGILRTAEDSRPLVHSSSPSSSSSSSQTISDGYVNEGICGDTAEANVVFNKFGDSCQRSLTTSQTTGAEGSPRYNHSQVALYPQSGMPISLRNDSLSLKEQHELKGAPWFQAGIPREISLEVLCRQNPGSFLVRQSTTKPGCFALSLRVPPPAPKVAHYLILRTIRGYKIKGFTKEFSSLRALITHHSVMPELLPVPLALPRPPQVGQRQEDPEMYGSLNEFQKILAD
ncbi:EGFR adapter protein-like [Wyeomyia smithii]|uniref:EGFR adapter protein-like n=1 Tax=Wyeomyia smithii TaxID=174621 RepID=UPI002467ED8E|nr:EGFR adapter protein-like [Wyeomyia smithii]XP_055528864.1 EGFR adapter protein-like [Wyeomyia smithii]XP_055528866.1 EGFR adapter protein-like [Wyeomyia smithii]XP_055528867.1 EGFR adapter protein-like [Wyeomyia smithii]XP_055528868.1 EGFR adapter protein-like [Wyeomyia smithii]XP_055528869.1 EGFR adapter protein-like [Wyeomyia smithii]XP_055528870.1 EGFR adapter protein-like [Wyeomyia smithii]XP_055528871.1 EGFR adapter protein-like [Wyeomyia smithii]XP_055528872.1 EGFR adapter protein